MKTKLLMALLLLYKLANAQWTAVNTGLTDTSITAFATSGSTIYTGTLHHGVFISTNNGDSWTPINNGLTHLIISSLAVSGASVFAGTNYSEVFLSTNSGNSWTSVSNGLTGIVNSFAVIGNTIYAGTSSAIYLFNGTGWTTAALVPNTMQSYFINEITTNGTAVFAATTSQGIQLLENGDSLVPVHSGITNLQVHDFISIAASSTSIFAGSYGSDSGNGDHEIFFSNDNGNSWAPANDPSIYSVNALITNGDAVFAGTYHGVYASTNNGSSWHAFNDSIDLFYLNIRSLIISGTSIFAGTGFAGIFRRPVSEVTGIRELTKNNTGYSAYPNPFSTTVTIKPATGTQSLLNLKNAGIKLYDFCGQEVAASSYTYSSQLSEIQINRAQLPGGIYFYTVTLDSRIILSGKLIAE